MANINGHELRKSLCDAAIAGNYETRTIYNPICGTSFAIIKNLGATIWDHSELRDDSEYYGAECVLGVTASGIVVKFDQEYDGKQWPGIHKSDLRFNHIDIATDSEIEAHANELIRKAKSVFRTENFSVGMSAKELIKHVKTIIDFNPNNEPICRISIAIRAIRSSYPNVTVTELVSLRTKSLWADNSPICARRTSDAIGCDHVSWILLEDGNYQCSRS